MRSNGKWLALAENFRKAGYLEMDPRELESLYHKGGAVLYETREEVGDRYIYLYVAARKDESSVRDLLIWVDHTQTNERRGTTLMGAIRELVAKVPPGEKIRFPLLNASTLILCGFHYAQEGPLAGLEFDVPS